jgi:hypothetical protein
VTAEIKTGPEEGGGGGGGMGGGRHHHDSGGGGPGGDDGGGAPATHMRASNLPPVRLHLRLTNHGPNPVVVSVNDFESDLGNFVVQPDPITLPPNQPVQTDPMISQLGVSSDVIPLKVSIQLQGQTEIQTLNLRMVNEPAPLAPPLRFTPGAVSP